MLNGPEFYQVSHEALWITILGLTASGHPCDVAAVWQWVQDHDAVRTHGDGVYLAGLLEHHRPGLAERAVAAIIERHNRRQEIDIAQAMIERAYTPGDMLTDDRRLLAETELAQRATHHADDLASLMTLRQFNAQELPEEEWVFPGLLAHGDRLMLTGHEGLGKSTLNRQFAVCAGAGISPFDGTLIKPQRTLFIDCENPQRLMIERFRKLAKGVEAHTKQEMPEPNFWIDRRPAGINLLDAKERRWMVRRLKQVEPSVLVIGPIYKMMRGLDKNEHDETRADQLTQVIDEWREEFDLTVILEAHSAKGESRDRPVTPIGTSLWLRWVDFGLGLRPADRPDRVPKQQQKQERLCDLVQWKTRDDEREWPYQVMAAHGDREMPWVQAPPDIEGN